MPRVLTFSLAALLSPAALAADAEGAGGALDLTADAFGLGALALFVVAYGLVIAEEFLHLRKSKPVMVAAGLIWTLVGVAYALHGGTAYALGVLRHNLLEYGELLLFLLAAMTYINTLQEREVFGALRARLISAGLSLRSLFWLTGLLAFFISPFADNLTTALIMGSVAIAVGAGNPRFITVSCVNIVVAANAGGAFSPFGDVTTLMVWQQGDVRFWEFFHLFIPSAVNWLVPALLMSFAVTKDKPAPVREAAAMKHGGMVVMALFLLTIVMAVAFHNFLGFPPVLGMMTGLGLLGLYGYRLQRLELQNPGLSAAAPFEVGEEVLRYYKPRKRPFDVFISMKRAEWDTLMFFYGVILCVGGLGALGYLAVASEYLYTGLGATAANILVGLLSAVVDNIPVMFAVLTMNPDMSLGQWLLVTLTAGVGGSLLSIGSAAGVALMGQARGIYTFFSHLKWSWAIALGYAASIGVHLALNGHLHHVAIGG
jgi:Na+/H+ antiporter NhaD/arsenite permease-like protein